MNRLDTEKLLEALQKIANEQKEEGSVVVTEEERLFELEVAQIGKMFETKLQNAKHA